jgi:pimeloyl-ACP methyl ester carboxylesterase
MPLRPTRLRHARPLAWIARLKVIADAGHDLTLEHPVVTARRVAGFFEGDGG